MPGGFWTSETLKQRLPNIVEPFNEEAIVSCGYEMSVGSEAFVTGENATKQFLEDGETVIIPPGQVALILTKETLTAPSDALGLLSFKSTEKLRGLINVSGFHVDPGFQGKLVFSMYNAGVQTIHLSVGSRLFMLWFCSLDAETKDAYRGGHNGQLHLPDNAVTNLAARMPSPFTLEKEVEALRNELRTEIAKLRQYVGLFLGVAVTALIASFRGCAQTPPAPIQIVPPGITPTTSVPAPVASTTNPPNATASPAPSAP